LIFRKGIGDIEVAFDAPRQIPPTKKSSQLLPKRPSMTIDIGYIDPYKSPSEIICKISKGACHNILPHIHLNLLHNPFVSQ
jgi:hypothetical protein